QSQVCVFTVCKNLQKGPSQQMALLTPSPKRSMPKAHLTAAKMETTAKLENILPWESNLGNAFTDSGFAYTDNALLIPESGRYFVYAQVTFRALMHDHGKRGCEPVRLSQTISKMTNGYPTPSDLITSFKTVECGSDTWMKSLYSGAVFLLEKGDKLMVLVNNITLVDFTDEKKTFFGAYLL
uniref:Lymphotoxin-alpha n=1 Tax=Lepisosteus oculatus TaxID=7918 RepID=W5MBI8_LEPOC